MIEIIAGEKGKGKTKHLLERVNQEVANSHGSVVFLDKSHKHMYDISNKIRLINVNEYPITNSSEFLGFICGIVSQDNDLEAMYLDSFMTIANISVDEMCPILEKLDVISETYNVKFVLCVSRSAEVLPESAKARVVVSL